MTEIKLVTVDSPNGEILRERAEEVSNIETQVLPFYEAAVKIMKENNGIGLAAPQIGVPYQWFIDRFRRLYINPVILKGKQIAEFSEGCLSLPGHTHQTARHKIVMVEYTEENGNRITKSFTNMIAVIVQHEYDHLQGRLIDV